MGGGRGREGNCETAAHALRDARNALLHCGNAVEDKFDTTPDFELVIDVISGGEESGNPGKPAALDRLTHERSGRGHGLFLGDLRPHQCALMEARIQRRAEHAGNVSRMVVPIPGELSISISASCRWTIPYTMASPNPLPS